MKKVKMSTVTSTKLTVNENRLVELTIRKINKINTKAEMRKYEASVLAMLPSRRKEIIVLTGIVVRVIKGKLGMPRGEYNYLAQSQVMYQAQFNNELGYFTPPLDELDQWNKDNGAFSDALTAIKNGTKGAAGLKSKALTNLKATLKMSLDYVNKLCLKRQDIAKSIIGAALMYEINTGSRTKSDITVSLGTDSGTIKVSCPRVKVDGKNVDATYHKGYSTDGAKTWTDLVSLPTSKTVATKLTVGIPHIFRSSTTCSKNGTTAWVYSKSITPQ